MANNLTITRSVVDGTVFTAAQNSTQCSDIETFINTTKLTGDNIQAAAITSTELGTGAVTSAKITAGAVGTAALASSAVTTAIIADANVTTAKIADAAVTQAKRVALGQQISSSCGTYNFIQTTQTDVTNLSVSITSTGRPIMLMIQPDGSSAASLLHRSNGSFAISTNLFILRDSSTIASWSYLLPTSITNNTYVSPMYTFVDTGTSAATYTYKIQANYTGGGAATLSNVKLVAYEV